MDLAADSLLALSNTAVALATKEDPLTDDDGSSTSSLSELDDELEDLEEEEAEPIPQTDADSEAETERLQITPESATKRKPFEISPSKLSQRQDIDLRPEIESLTESAVSSPISSHDDSENEEELSDGREGEEEVQGAPVLEGPTSPFKRKREESTSDVEDAPRPQRRRTGSPDSNGDKSDAESEIDIAPIARSREQTLEPEVEDPEQEDVAEVAEEEQKEVEKTDTSEDSKGKSRGRLRRKTKEPVTQEAQPEEDEDAEAGEESDAGDENDADAALKSEEEQAKRMHAMESLVALEKHFATLRDRLYDERIAAINHELQLLQESKPAHPELLRQVEVVQKHRDEKFEVEQKLLVYKVGALKNKAVAERSQIHSQYFQTVRDIRERHLERSSEHFYRIQRDRFKADSSVPNFSIPFPEKKSQQIIQQTAYNKEVSILSGVAKYVGFPAAPELAASKLRDVEEDISKMGISPPQIRPSRPSRRPALQQQISGPQAEEQFLEQTPWANPQHPIHRISRQNSNRSPMNEFFTPSNQQRNITDNLPPGGSASTIVDPSASAQASSVINTPFDGTNGAAKTENAIYRVHTASPLDMRRQLNETENDQQTGKDKDVLGLTARELGTGMGSSPLTSRAYLNTSATRPPAITAGSGRFSVR